jgi:hypothetical protein
VDHQQRGVGVARGLRDEQLHDRVVTDPDVPFDEPRGQGDGQPLDAAGPRST